MRALGWASDLEEGPGDGDALLLAAGQLQAALADQRGVAVRHAQHLVMDGRLHP